MTWQVNLAVVWIQFYWNATWSDFLTW